MLQVTLTEDYKISNIVRKYCSTLCCCSKQLHFITGIERNPGFRSASDIIAQFKQGRM